MGFAGVKCRVLLSDGREIDTTQSRSAIAQRMSRVSSRWPLVELQEAGGGRRFVAGAHIVELVSTEPED